MCTYDCSDKVEKTEINKKCVSVSFKCNNLLTICILRYADCYLFPAVGYPLTLRGGEGASETNIAYNNYQVRQREIQSDSKPLDCNESTLVYIFPFCLDEKIVLIIMMQVLDGFVDKVWTSSTMYANFFVHFSYHISGI